MATLMEQVTQDIADAMREKNQATLAPLRMLKAALMNREVEKGRALDEAESLQVVDVARQTAARLDRAVPRGRPAGSGRSRTGRDRRFSNVTCRRRPTRRPIAQAIDAAVAETGATGPKDMGKVMKAVMAHLAGADRRRPGR